MQRLEKVESGEARVGGLTGWLLRWIGRRQPRRRRLVLEERIALGPKQLLALVEADGQRILVASSADGGAAFYPLEERTERAPKVRCG